MLLICFLIMISFQFVLLKNNKNLMLIQNVFFVILFFISAFSSFVNYKPKKDLAQFKNRYLNLLQKDSINKPVILIILDEYSSPLILSKVFNNNSILDFSNGLKKKGWKIKNELFSYEISTIHSLSSLFNYNLSLNGQYSQIDPNQIGATKLMQSKLSDSLSKKGVMIINYGIFDFGIYQPLTRLYYYPKNFFEQLLYHTSYQHIFYNTNKMQLDGLKYTYYPNEMHNKKIINSLFDTTNSLKSNKYFIYVHLYMPHAPKVYSPEFSFKIDSKENYLAFWKFTNNKLEELISRLTIESKFRIIISGDHGYRNNPKIDRNKTFAAFYGFSETDLKKINSVQDLGSLINGYL